MKHTPSFQSRRRFIKHSGCAALTAVPVLSTLTNMSIMSRAAASQSSVNSGDVDDYKALVCVFHFGGWDSGNIFVPGGHAYENYKKARGGLYTETDSGIALPTSELESLDGRRFFDEASNPLLINSKLPNIRKMLNGAADAPTHAALIANVGTLVKSGTNKNNYDTPEYSPYGLFSHSDQQRQWQTSFRSQRSANGWAGDLVDCFYAGSEDAPSWASSISIGVTPYWQTGGLSKPYVTNGGNSVEAIGSQTGYGASYRTNFENSVGRLLNGDMGSRKNGVLARVFHDMATESVDQADILAKVYEVAEQLYADETGTTGPKSAYTLIKEDGISGPLGTVAELIAIRDMVAKNPGLIADKFGDQADDVQKALGTALKRQTFFMATGGWDMHDDVISGLPEKLPYVDNLVQGFFRAIKYAGLEDKVTLFFGTDFGRTLRTNGNGSDHAWGGHVLVFGNDVQRGTYGEFPENLNDLGDLDAKHGRIIPTTSVDSLFATLAQWMGVTNSNELELIFDALKDPSFSKDLGFLG